MFENCTFRLPIFIGTFFKNTTFSDCTFQEPVFHKTKHENTFFKNCYFSTIDTFNISEFIGCTFSNCIFKNINKFEISPGNLTESYDIRFENSFIEDNEHLYKITEIKGTNIKRVKISE